MKRLAAIVCSVGLLVLGGCEKMTSRIDDLETSYEDLSKRVALLEELCKNLNTEITSLSTLVNVLEGKDYVTGVTPLTEDGKTIGYSIGFTKSAPVTIYHGKNGADGADGADGAAGTDGKDGVNGHSPVIGVKKDTDGIFYWTLDGEWLRDSDKQKIPASAKDGADGEPGAPGAPGADGKDGIAPQLKIEDGYWYVSVDNGVNWDQLGKATGEAGKDGDSFFQSVDTSDSDYVTLTLADGTELQLPRYKQLKITLSTTSFTVANETITVDYTLQNTVADTYVAVVYGNCQEIKRTSATTGTIKVNVDINEDSYVLVMATDTKGNIATAVIQLTKGQITFPDGPEYMVFKEAQSLTIPFKLNYSYRAEVAPEATSWLSITKTKGALRDGSVVLSVKFNSGTTTRSGKVNLINSETGNVFSTVTVTQSHHEAYSYYDENEVFQGVGIPIVENVNGTVKTVVWAPVNLGYTSKYKFGKLYQWGRVAGHGYGEPDENNVSVTVATSPATSTSVFTNPDPGTFYVYSSKTTYDWYAGSESMQLSTGWNQITKTDYIGNPCPDGWRVPTSAELEGLKANCSKWTSNGARMGYYFKGNNSALDNDKSVFLPAGGYRIGKDGSSTGRNAEGSYRSSDLSGIKSYYLYFSLSGIRIDEANRSFGQSVRCVSSAKS